jgi:DNA-binding transcriptional regulator YdaS (Cro superfamily)
MLIVQMSSMPTSSLKSFLDQLPDGGVTALAGRLGIHRVYLSQLAARLDGREPSPALCVRIERETDRAVCRWSLRPGDWHLIWPELVSDEHPAPTAIEPTAQEVTRAA